MPAHIRRQGQIAEVVLDWPEVRNAIGPIEARELRLALEEATSDESLGALVLSGEGKAFCAGGNLPAIIDVIRAGGKDAVSDRIYTDFQGIFRLIQRSPIPVIAAVDGPAIGWGCDLALAGSVTFIGAKGWLAQGWIKAGLVPATGGTLYAMRRGGAQAVWHLLTADRVDGATAEGWKFATACENARESALAMAEKLASLPRAPMLATKRLTELENFDDHLDRALKYQVEFLTDPGFEALAAKALSK